jgi:hypothetical protein
MLCCFACTVCKEHRNCDPSEIRLLCKMWQWRQCEMQTVHNEYANVRPLTLKAVCGVILPWRGAFLFSLPYIVVILNKFAQLCLYVVPYKQHMFYKLRSRFCVVAFEVVSEVTRKSTSSGLWPVYFGTSPSKLRANLLPSTWWSRNTPSSQHGGITLHRNVGGLRPHYMALHSRRQNSSVVCVFELRPEMQQFLSPEKSALHENSNRCTVGMGESMRGLRAWQTKPRKAQIATTGKRVITWNKFTLPPIDGTAWLVSLLMFVSKHSIVQSVYASYVRDVNGFYILN